LGFNSQLESISIVVWWQTGPRALESSCTQAV